MKQIVGVADMKVSTTPGDVIVTHALGSCLGIAVHDPVAGVGGLLHVMMPEGRMNQEKAEANPFMFVDTGVPVFFREVYAAFPWNRAPKASTRWKALIWLVVGARLSIPKPTFSPTAVDAVSSTVSI